jgi:hypothetical protein
LNADKTSTVLSAALTLTLSRRGAFADTLFELATLLVILEKSWK